MRHMPAPHRLLAVALLAFAATHAGCSQSGSSGGGGAPVSGESLASTAMDATLARLTTSFRTGTPTLDSSISVGAVANPLVVGSDSDTTVALGGNTHDGTAATARVQVTASRDAAGTESATVRVIETVSQQAFLSLLLNVTRVQVDYRLAPLGLANLSNAGTGEAFALVRYTYQGEVRREFQNLRNTVTLIDYGGFSPPAVAFTQFATFSGFREYVIHYQITGTASGSLVARITRLEPAASGLIFQRTGGAAASAVTQVLDQVTVDGIVAVEGSDTAAVIGPDPTSGRFASATAPVVANLRFGGGVNGGLFSTAVTGPVTPAPAASPGFALNYSGTLTGLTQVGDGVVQADQFVRFVTTSRESPAAAALVHSLEGQLGTLSATFTPLVAELEQAIYLPGVSSMEQALLLYR